MFTEASSGSLVGNSKVISLPILFIACRQYGFILRNSLFKLFIAGINNFHNLTFANLECIKQSAWYIKHTHADAYIYIHIYQATETCWLSVATWMTCIP